MHALKQEKVSQKKLREAGEIYTPAEVALRLKVKGGAPTVLDWIHRGDSRGRHLGCYKMGRYYRISEAHLEEFLG